MNNIKTYPMSDVDRHKLESGYNLIASVYEYNIGSSDPNDKKLCKKLEKALKILSETVDKEFIPGATL